MVEVMPVTTSLFSSNALPSTAGTPRQPCMVLVKMVKTRPLEKGEKRTDGDV